MSVSGVGPAGGAFDTGATDTDTGATGSTASDPDPAPTVRRGGASGRPVLTTSGPETAAARRALGEALSNDARGVVSERDAAKIVGAALGAIATAADPRGVFEAAKRVIQAARLTASSDPDVKRLLDGYEARGAAAVDARLAVLAGGAALPMAAQDAFVAMLTTYETASGERLAEGAVRITDVRGDAASGFSFKYASDRGEGTGFALDYDGQWFFAPRPVERGHLDAITEAWRARFDAEWADDMRDNWGSTDDEIRAAREALKPTRMLWPGESDPYDYASTFPMVIEVENATGSDHGFFAAFNPATGELEAYDFN